MDAEELIKENKLLKLKIKQLEEEECEIRRSEAFLRENQITIEQILASAPVMLYIYDLHDRKNVFINKEVTYFLGFSDIEVQSMGSQVLKNLIHPADLHRCLVHHSKLLQAEEGQILQVKYRMKNSKGEWRYFQGSDTPFNKQTGQSTRYILGCAQEVQDHP